MNKYRGVDEHDIREQPIKELREEMVKQVARRTYRFEDAAMQLDTTTQWDLVAAAVEETNINYHRLTGKKKPQR